MLANYSKENFETGKIGKEYKNVGKKLTDILKKSLCQ